MFDQDFINQFFGIPKEGINTKSNCYFHENVQDLGAHIPRCNYYETLYCNCDKCNKYINKSDAYAVVKEHIDTVSKKDGYDLCNVIKRLKESERNMITCINGSKGKDKTFDQIAPYVISLLMTYTDVLIDIVRIEYRNED